MSSSYNNIVGTDTADNLTASGSGDSITALAGNDTLTGFGGNDIADLGAGNDTVALALLLMVHPFWLAQAMIPATTTAVSSTVDAGAGTTPLSPPSALVIPSSVAGIDSIYLKDAIESTSVYGNAGAGTLDGADTIYISGTASASYVSAVLAVTAFTSKATSPAQPLTAVVATTP